MFKIIKKSKISNARLGVIKTPHGLIRTPCFMPDATRGVIKQLSNGELTELGLECFVANTLHLYLRPGLKIIKRSAGLHKFMNWPRPILTDSGGYQVFSLIHNSSNSGKITDAGAIFRSPLDGAKLVITPELSIKIQFTIGSDLIVCFDDCPPNGYNDSKLTESVERTIKWAARCKKEYEKNCKKNNKRPLLFAVIQGGNNLKLREHCAKELIKIGFDGYGFGARHIDEHGVFLSKTLDYTAQLIPEDKIRFGLGIGSPGDILKAIKMGWDLFDCVIPTREGRHGRLFLKKGVSYKTINITNAKFAKDFSPINPASKLTDLQKYSKAYLNYLFKINEPLAARLASLHNLEFYLKIMEEARDQIKSNKL